jgi:hypothetical protein
LKTSPRQPRTRLAAALCGACVALSPCGAASQEQKPAARHARQRAPAKEAGPAATPRKGDAKAQARERRERQQAVAALLEVSDGARALEDLDARAEVLSRAADALWPADEPSARAVFRRAWEAATAADLADTKRREEELRAKRADGSSPPVTETTRARFAALGTLARRDPRMAEKFLGELGPTALDEEDDGGGVAGEVVTNENASARREDERALSPRGAQRLRLALDLLERGDPAHAAQVAAPLAAEAPTREFLQFLLLLRTRAPREADALYARLLRGGLASGANDVLVLSSYVVSPQLIITVSPDASVQLNPQWHANADDAEGLSVPANVRRAFFDLAAALLLRPARPASNEREALDEASALFFAAGRLLPFFERDAPRHAPALRARMEALAAGIDEARRERLSAHMPTESMRLKNPSDPLSRFVEEMSDPVGRAERFGMRLRAVSEAARRKLWDRARRLAADTEDADTRREALALIASYQIKFLEETFADAEDESDFERAAAFAREADVPPSVRARGLAQAAEMAARKGKRERASELLEEAVAQALRADKGTGQRLDVLTLLTSTAARLDPARAWELMPEVVREANALDDAPPPPPEAADALAGVLAHNGKPSEEIFDQFPPEELFATMARNDFARALTEARALQDGETRALALIAAARPVAERGAKAPGVASRSEKN